MSSKNNSLKNELRRAMRAARRGRDAKGRWTKGNSGNPNGRPPKEPESPKLLDELIAEKLWEKVQVTDTDGKVRMVSRYEQIVEGLVDSLVTAKPKDAVQILEFLEKRGLFHRMKIMAEPECGNPFEEKHNDWLETQLQLKEMDHALRRFLRTKKSDAQQYDVVFGPPLDG